MNIAGSTRDEITELRAYGLAYRAGCMSPDTQESPGAEFLARVRDAFVEALEYADDASSLDDAWHDTADAAVPVYTAELWRVFADLGAWETEISDYVSGDDVDMTRYAGVALYVIARDLLESLWTEFRLALESSHDATCVECAHDCPWQGNPIGAPYCQICGDHAEARTGDDSSS